jgi:hypothetical protein
LFESLGAIAPDLLAENDKYKLFAKKRLPVLAQCREQLAEFIKPITDDLE